MEIELQRLVLHGKQGEAQTSVHEVEREYVKKPTGIFNLVILQTKPTETLKVTV